MDQKRDMIAVSAPAVSIRALTWGRSNGPIALCLHGFPDTAHGWRKVAPLLAAAGWKWWRRAFGVLHHRLCLPIAPTMPQR